MNNKIILGIDPGSRITGYGVIKSNGIQHKFIHCGCIQVASLSLASRLQKIFEGLKEIINFYQPDEVAIEQIFMHQNPNSALKLGQARGAALVVVAVHQIPIAEYSARQIKQSVVGYGAASKLQMQHMIKTLFSLSELPTADAADALATAFCHATTNRVLQKINHYKNRKE